MHFHSRQSIIAAAAEVRARAAAQAGVGPAQRRLAVCPAARDLHPVRTLLQVEEVEEVSTDEEEYVEEAPSSVRRPSWLAGCCCAFGAPLVFLAWLALLLRACMHDDRLRAMP